MKKSVKCAVLSVLMVCVFVFSLPLTSFAATSYNMNINEPAKGINQGYILLLVESSSGTRQLQCISWTLLPVFTDDNTPYTATEMNITISNTNKTVDFLARSNGNFQMSAGFGLSLSGDSLRTKYWYAYRNEVGFSYTYSLGSNNVIGYQIYGNGVLISHDVGTNNNQPFSVVWGDDSNLTSKLTELIALATEMCANDEEMLSELNKILGDTSAILTNTADIERLCNSIISWLSQMDTRIKAIQGNTDTMVKRLDLIIQILQGKGESSFEEPNTEGISEYDKAEDELVSGADDTSDIEEQIEDFEIDSNSSRVVWSVINGFIKSHEKVFGLVIGILCLGIIALILNR